MSPKLEDFFPETFYGTSNMHVIAHLWGKGNRFVFSNSKCIEAKNEKKKKEKSCNHSVYSHGD